MIRVGLTGGIGSGKSTVARLFATLGVPVYDSDARGKWLLANDPQVIARVRAAFGPEAYRDGLPDTKYLAGVVFADLQRLQTLNGIVHPAVRADFAAWSREQASAPYVIMESAILFESGMDADVDQIVVVTAPESLRIERTVRRDGSSPDAIRRRMAAQMSDSQRIARANHILDASETTPLIPQVLTLDRMLRAGS